MTDGPLSHFSDNKTRYIGHASMIQVRGDADQWEARADVDDDFEPIDVFAPTAIVEAYRIPQMVTIPLAVAERLRIALVNPNRSLPLEDWQTLCDAILEETSRDDDALPKP